MKIQGAVFSDGNQIIRIKCYIALHGISWSKMERCESAVLSAEIDLSVSLTLNSNHRAATGWPTATNANINYFGGKYARQFAL